MNETTQAGREPASGVRAALAAVAELLGTDRVVEADEAGPAVLGPNVSRYRSRRVHGLIRPRTAEEVRRLVEVFGRHPEAGGLHPFSKGRNWGLGSKEPARDGVVAVDLSDLDRVRALDVGAGWAVIEPGVGQGRLAQLLEGTERMLNVTSAAADSSVVGNALDRGVGLRQQRVDDLLGLEVVLPDGELVRVGWWPDEHRPTPVYPHGLGPSLVQLFVQSSLGIVTAAAVRLLPRPEALRVVRLNFPPEVLPGAIDELRRWVAQGLVRGVLKVYNPRAAGPYGGAAGEYLVHACVDGTAAAVAALTGIVMAEAAGSGLFSDVSCTDAEDPERPEHESAKLVERSYAGDPDLTDALFRAKMGQPADQVDELVGFLFFLPLVPFTGPAIGRAQQLLARASEATGLQLGATLHALGPDLIDYVVTAKFDRSDESTERAHRTLDLLYELFADEGFTPYRLDVDHVDWIDRFTPDSGQQAFVRRLKSTIDPKAVIAPGRYLGSAPTI